MSGLIKHNHGLVMSEDQEALLKNVLEVPEDDNARLIYADYLECELGDESSVCHAHLIRHQIEKHQSGKSCKSLDRKERKWLSKIQIPDVYYFKNRLKLGDVYFTWRWERGFINQIHCAYGHFTNKNSQWSWNPPILKFGYSIPVLRLDELLFGRYPITKLSIYDAHEMIRVSPFDGEDIHQVGTSRVDKTILDFISDLKIHNFSMFLHDATEPGETSYLVYRSIKSCLSAIQLGSINYARDHHGLTALELSKYPQPLSI